MIICFSSASYSQPDIDSPGVQELRGTLQIHKRTSCKYFLRLGHIERYYSDLYVCTLCYNNAHMRVLINRTREVSNGNKTQRRRQAANPTAKRH
jgi:hypothetical protein